MPFRILVRLESIGDAQRDYLRAVRRGEVKSSFDRIQRAECMGGQRPYVARLVDLDARTAFKREYLKPHRDFSQANGTGSRGIFDCYLLEEGNIYEIRRRTSWKNSETSIVKIVDQQLVTMTHGEALRWFSALRSDSASTS